MGHNLLNRATLLQTCSQSLGTLCLFSYVHFIDQIVFWSCTILLLTNCEVHVGKCLDLSFDAQKAKVPIFSGRNTQLVTRSFASCTAKINLSENYRAAMGKFSKKTYNTSLRSLFFWNANGKRCREILVNF